MPQPASIPSSWILWLMGGWEGGGTAVPCMLGPGWLHCATSCLPWDFGVAQHPWLSLALFLSFSSCSKLWYSWLNFQSPYSQPMTTYFGKTKQSNKTQKSDPSWGDTIMCPSLHLVPDLPLVVLVLPPYGFRSGSPHPHPFSKDTSYFAQSPVLLNVWFSTRGNFAWGDTQGYGCRYFWLLQLGKTPGQ